MGRHVLADRAATSSTSTAISQPFAGIAFSVWAGAFAVGALIHVWQEAVSLWAVGPLVAVAAFAVILRPTSPARLVVLFGLLFIEVLDWLPDLLNHQILVAVLGVTFVGWWLGFQWRSPVQAHDPGVMYERVAPYLRGQLAHAMRLRVAPDVSFQPDTALEYALHVDKLLHQPEVLRDLEQ